MQKSSAALVEALHDPSCYDHPVDRIKLIETHISWVFLAGQFAYKLKKPVNFGFLDFSTLQKRLRSPTLFSYRQYRWQSEKANNWSFAGY